MQDDFDNDVDALLEEGLCAPKKRKIEEKYAGESDHLSDGETTVQPMMTKIKTVLKSKLLLGLKFRLAVAESTQLAVIRNINGVMCMVCLLCSVTLDQEDFCF